MNQQLRVYTNIQFAGLSQYQLECLMPEAQRHRWGICPVSLSLSLSLSTGRFLYSACAFERNYKNQRFAK